MSSAYPGQIVATLLQGSDRIRLPFKFLVDGGFTEWSLFGSCSKTCGGGVMRRNRSCTNPVPANGGQDCIGPREETRNCSIEACPGSLFNSCF